MSAKTPTPPGLALTRRQLVAWLASGLFFVAYAGTLVWMTYQAQSQRQQADYLTTRLEAEKRVAAVAYFFSERRNDLADLADSTEVPSYFANQALGMSLEYGLRANLLSILERMNRLQETKRLGAAPIYRRLALIDQQGDVLAATDPTLGEDAQRLAGIAPQAVLPTISSDARTGEIVVSAPVRSAQGINGQLVAWIGAEQLQQHFLSWNSESTMTLLLPAAGQVLLPSGLLFVSPDLIAAVSALPEGRWLRWPAGTLAPGDPELLVTALAVGDTPFRLVSLVQLDELHSAVVSRTLLVAAAIVPLVFLVGLLVLVRLYRANRNLAEKTAHVSRENSDLTVRYGDLESEIRQRERVEQSLLLQRKLLEDKTVALEQTTAEALYLAQYDSLTKLSNRIYFRDGLQQAMARASRNGTRLAVMFIDLDHFKRINDTLGHSAGDRLLQEVADRLGHSVRATDMTGPQRLESDYHLARQGGDEFTVLLAELDDPLSAGVVAQRILDELTRPIILENNEVVVTASIGISIFPNDGADVDTLLKNADVSMYSSKAKGRNQYQFFEAALQDHLVRRLTLESDMRQAIANRQLSLYYQPQVDAVSGELISFEALMRWTHPERGLILPGEFIPVAEETGLILLLTQLALRQAGADIVNWKARFGMDIRVAINISGRVIELTDLEKLLNETIVESGISPALIEIELTESMLMEGGEKTRRLLEQLRALGVRIAIDDFGTGYSSLSYLRALPIDVLKIDKSFVSDICIDQSSATIARTIIAMAHNLGMSVVAEGVETAAQRDFLRDAQCEVLQGYLFSRPLPVAEVLELLAIKALLKAA